MWILPRHAPLPPSPLPLHPPSPPPLPLMPHNFFFITVNIFQFLKCDIYFTSACLSGRWWDGRHDVPGDGLLWQIRHHRGWGGGDGGGTGHRSQPAVWVDADSQHQRWFHHHPGTCVCCTLNFNLNCSISSWLFLCPGSENVTDRTCWLIQRHFMTTICCALSLTWSLWKSELLLVTKAKQKKNKETTHLGWRQKTIQRFNTKCLYQKR